MSGDANGIFTTLEIDTIGEIMNISMGSAATAASTLLDSKVSITSPQVSAVTLDDLSIAEYEPALAVEVKYVEGINGSSVLIFRKNDLQALLNLMLPQELEDDFELDDMTESAVSELMNQMMGASATVLSCFLGRTINISTPEAFGIDVLEEFKERYLPGAAAALVTEFTLSVGDVVDSKFINLMDVSLAKEIIDVSLNFDSSTLEDELADPAAEQEPEPAPAQPSTDDLLAAAQAMAAQQAVQQQPQPMPAAPPASSYTVPPAPDMGMYAAPAAVEQPIEVRDYDFKDFSGPAAGAQPATNMELVMNVPVMVTVELGRTKRKIKEILEFGQGTIVELDKQAGSQVDVIVNGQLIARGDVVVVDDNFSVRITEILKNRDTISLM